MDERSGSQKDVPHLCVMLNPNEKHTLCGF